MANPALVSVVDDDESVRESLTDLLRQVGLVAQSFASAEAFLDSDAPDRTGCLVLDISMPGMSGPELQRHLLQQQRSTPIVFITASVDDATRQRLLDLGAVACLTKPFDERVLLEAIHAALRR